MNIENESMDGTVKETPCTSCIHRKLCKYKDTFLDIIRAVNDVDITLGENDFGKVEMNNVHNFDFIEEISVICHYRNRNTSRL